MKTKSFPKWVVPSIVATAIVIATWGTFALGGCQHGEPLAHGYTRDGSYVRFRGHRIDQKGAEDLAEFAVIVGHPLTLATDVDADSFVALSEEYSRDRNRVYYKWISGPSFWVVEVPRADPDSFEVLGLGFARDRNHVWRQDSIVPGADGATVRSLFDHRVWVDANHVWAGLRRVPGADPATFERLGDSYFYRDAEHVYWAFNQVTVLEGADPATFRLDPSNKAYGIDRNGRWNQRGPVK